MLDPYTLFLIAAVGLMAAFFILLLMTIWSLWELGQEVTPETQDDFQVSAARWGYLADRRAGE